MNPSTTLTIAARDEDDFDDLMARAFAMFDRPPVQFERTNSGQTITYQASILHSFAGNDEKLVVTLDFDTKALMILGVDLGGREALAAAESEAMH